MVATKLINDSNVKEKQKAKYRELVKKMKDFRNVINLIAVINMLGEIAAYQNGVRCRRPQPLKGNKQSKSWNLA